MAEAIIPTPPRGLMDTTLARLDAIFLAFWSKLEERQREVSLPHHSPPEPLWTFHRLHSQDSLLYLLQEESVWKILVCRWKSLLLFVLLTAAIILVPFFVYQMKTLSHPPPDVLFIAAAICSGTIAETLLIKYIIWYCVSQYNEAKMSSYSIKPKTIKQHGDRGLQCPAGETSTAVVNMTEQENQNRVLQSNTNYMKLSV
ncbi:Hypothetical predicted protein [Pelobates cultripes]|uniref:Uncharacterized protein n=1 Tax=Pelobates cultripes TaxID=61616 RepID=A0AAD1WFW9_PELCU|nr:Hypothetical predicted protein [Pelobates cultripes]